MKKVVFLMLAVIYASIAFGQQTVAVYVTGGQEEGANDMLSASLKEAITNSRDYVAVERTASFLQQLRKEQKYQRSGNVDDDDIARLGRESGAKYVCVAELMSVSGGDFVTARLIGVENASVVATADGADKITSLETLMRVSEAIAAQLLQYAVLNQSVKSKARVAVYVTGEAGDGETNKILGIKLVSAITKSAQYAAVERTDAFLKQLRSEQDYQSSGNVDDDQLAALGKQFGVQYVCAAKVSRAYGSKALTISLIDVETANVTAVAFAALSGSDINSLISVTQKISMKIAGKTEAEIRVEAEAEAVAETRAEAVKKQALNSIEQNMVYVQGGTFRMGCTSEQKGDCRNDEKPVHKVTLNNFYMSKYEVTQAQWKALMGSNPSFDEEDDLPVEQVSWNDVQIFIKRLNAATGKYYRLPTEAEWEYVARGGTQSRGYQYSGSNTLDEVAWYQDNSGDKPHPVGTKRANELGIYDMSGNVSEWCYDWYGTYPASAQNNPTGASSGSYRVTRSSSWGSGAGYCRVAHRSYNLPEFNAFADLGFRLACSVETANVTAVETAEAKIAEVVKKQVINSIEQNMVYLQGGTFRMGDDIEKPVHEVRISSFYIGKYEITQAQWEALMGSNPSLFKGNDLPVELVRWNDAQMFIELLNDATGKQYRLPTEAEWEYAARGGSQSRGYQYSGSNTLDEVAWYRDNSGGKPHPVGTKMANELGIYDMSGNVYEWCYDWIGAYPASTQNNPASASSGSYRVTRGGSWFHYADDCHVARRNALLHGSTLGFRVACSSE
ncbi:MAG: SUMF1/EgtB/PvdO family nonheme iron enzyme [Bacteroidales bacterium]|jgi:formylglycine-generating enzyme required for sulfatase activity|nr:SUMF1/EgtB/PvdO family nonheme iron enzyme [Bacteroidales bacterium]